MKRAAILAFALLAAGCSEEAETPAVQQGGEAAGEVLGGTVSDAMIPLEQLQSEAPLIPRQTAASGASEGEGEGGGEDEADSEIGEGDPRSEGAEAAPAAPAPATPPAAE